MKKFLSGKIVIGIICAALLATLFTGCGESKKQVKVLILPHFEIGEMTGDDPGEAQYYYEEYLMDSQKYELSNGDVFYYDSKTGVAMSLTGMGKTNASSNLTCVLSDSRFDFTNAYIVCTGCSGGAQGYSTLGDVCIATAAVDYDLGYTADIRDMEGLDVPSTWFYFSDSDSSSNFILNSDLIDQIYELTKDITLQTTEASKETMAYNFPGEEWANRNPKVIKGTTVTGDQYWKGDHDSERANYIVEWYNCPDPYASTEMEDVALVCVANKYGMKDRTIILRGIVNIDTFLGEDNALTLWSGKDTGILYNTDYNSESIDIFNPCMKSVADVGIKIIDGILDGSVSAIK